MIFSTHAILGDPYVTLQEEMLAESYTGFLEHSLTEVRRHREVFPMPSKTHAIRLEALIK